ncbi:MAG: hypothetical protein AAFO82_10190 [Bacteroidota bacterium]
MHNLTIAVAEAAFQDFLAIARQDVNFETQGSSNTGAFSVSWDIAARLEGGTVTLNNAADEIEIRELDVVWDRLRFNFGIDIPRVCVGGQCIIRFLGKCRLRLPRICIFERNPDINLPLNLGGGVIESELSGDFEIFTRYFNNPARQGKTDHQAHFDATTNAWRVVPVPKNLDIDIIDIADTVGNLLDNLIDNLVDNLLGGLPGWAKDAIRFILGGLSSLIRRILDLGDDLKEWLFDLLTELGIFEGLFDKIADRLAEEDIISLEDPFPILKGELPDPSDSDEELISVLVPIRNLEVTVDQKEMVVQAEIS